MPDCAVTILLRASTDADVPAMLDIYTHHVQHGIGDFRPEPLPIGEIKRRRKVMLKRKMPHMVADYGGLVVGYALAAPFRKESLR